MARRIALFTKEDVSRAISGAQAGGLLVGEVRVLRDGSIVLRAASAANCGGDEDIDAKLEAFAQR